jgi:periplasmic protein TonB
MRYAFLLRRLIPSRTSLPAPPVRKTADPTVRASGAAPAKNPSLVDSTLAGFRTLIDWMSARSREFVDVASARARMLPDVPGLAGVSHTDRLVVYALGVSIVVHAVLLAIRFQPFDPAKRQDRGPPLEVALVNAKSKSKPTKADFLAQSSLDGGGNTDANRRATTPLPLLPKAGASGEIAVATQKIQALEHEAKELMTRLQSAPTAPAVPKPIDAPEPTAQPSATELMQRTLEAMRMEARIAKEMESYQQRPKRRFVGARADEYRFARYVEDWRSKIERVGNLNYPEAARQLKLYGSLLLTVSIKSDGSVEAVEINRSSGVKVLDAAAVKIVEMSAPFAAFPPDIRRDTDVLHITRTWMFTKGDELRSE